VVVFVLVCVSVSGTIRRATAELSQHDWQVRPAWLVLAGLLYVVGLVPMAWFWHRALAALGQPAPWPATLRAYFFGHLGKYVPGKAMAIILRVAAVRKWVTSMRVAIVSSLLETLTMMAVGAFLAAVLSIVALQIDLVWSVVAAGMALAFGLPTLPPVASRLAQLGIGRMKQPTEPDAASVDSSPIEPKLSGINLRLLITGWLAACVCWMLLGLSLWATLRAMGIESLDPLRDLPLMVATVSFAVAVGFASMLPGGLGVRDLVLVELLAPVCGAAGALVAAVLLRLVWLVSELAVCVILYVVAKFSSAEQN